jgi:hypothetical protein
VSRPAFSVVAAYGLRIDGLGAPEELAVRGAEHWPVIHLHPEVAADEAPAVSEIREDGATIANPAATLLVDRARSEVRVRSPAPVPVAEIIHPCLWPVAAVFARWRGAETLHAGAFAAPQRPGAWAVMADSGGGKTSFLAALALAGVEVIVDDLLVVERQEFLAGPRSLDLRPEVAERLGLMGATIPVRSTSRRRFALAPCEARWPVVGFVELGWGEDVAVERLRPSAALAALARYRRVLGLGTEFAELLELVARPVLRLTRPRIWASAPVAVQRLLEAVATTES